MRKVRLKLAGVLATAILFQPLQCAVDTEELLPGLVQTIGAVFITDYVNHIFGVQGTTF